MKTLKVGESYETPFGEQWDTAILTVDKIAVDYLEQTILFTVQIYKDQEARDNRRSSFDEAFLIDKETFVANFDAKGTIAGLKNQCEDYALTLSRPNIPMGEEGEEEIPFYNQFV